MHGCVCKMDNIFLFVNYYCDIWFSIDYTFFSCDGSMQFRWKDFTFPYVFAFMIASACFNVVSFKKKVRGLFFHQRHRCV